MVLSYEQKKKRGEIRPGVTKKMYEASAAGPTPTAITRTEKEQKLFERQQKAAAKDKAKKAAQHEKLVREREARHKRGRAREKEKAEARKEPGFVAEGERLTQLTKEQEAARKEEPIRLGFDEPIRLGQEVDRSPITGIERGQRGNLPFREAVALGQQDALANLEALKTAKFWDPDAKINVEAAVDSLVLAGPLAPAVNAVFDVIGVATTRVASRIVGKKVSKAISKVTFPKLNVDKFVKEGIITKDQAKSVAIQLGRRRTSDITSAIIQQAGYAVNAKTQAGTTSLLAKAGMGLGGLAIVTTMVGTYPFAQFELAEATDKIGIAMFKAANEEDWDTVDKLTQVMDELIDPSVWDKIANKIPFLNVFNNVMKNIGAAKIASDTYKDLAAKARIKAEEAEGEETFEERVTRVREEGREIELEEREEDEKYWAGIEEQRKEAKEEEREEEEEFWDNLFKERRENQERERAADDVYWEDIYAKNKKRKEDERAADEAYWAEIKRKNTGVGLTTEDKQVISDWNAGKSALNFKWLGR